MAFDYSSSFAGINSALSNLGKRFENDRKQQTLAALGQGIDGSPESYGRAAQSLLALGDVANATNFLALGEKARERTLNEAAIQSSPFSTVRAPVSSAAQAVPGPLAALGQPVAPAPRVFDRPVQVAETEEDTQRLEAEMARREQFGYGNPSLPAGMRNNNPGNIKFVGTRQAPGVVGPSQNTDQGDPQAVFNSPEAGMSAAYGLALRKYQGGKRTANDLIAGQNGWTPGNTAAAANIAAGMGLRPDEDLRLDDPQRAQAFLRALTAQEHGRAGGRYPAEMIRSAVVGSPQGQPVQVAQAPVQPGDPLADVRPEGGAAVEGPATTQAAQGFAIPGTSLPPNDPAPQVSNQQLLAIQANPRLASQHEIAKQILANRLKYTDENAPDKREMTRLQTEKLRREVEGEGGRPMTDAERKSYGVRDGQAAFIKKNGEPGFGPAGTQIINEAQKIQGAEDKARVDINTKFLGTLADAGPKVSQRMADMDMLASVIRDAPAGPVADTQVFFDRIGAGLGLSKGELATRSDAMRAIIQRLAPAQREEGSGSTSDIEFKGMLASFPSLAATAEGRQMILTTIARQNELTQMRVEVANQWAQGDIPATEARKRVAQIDRASIYASEDEKKLVRKLAGTAKGGDLGATSGPLRRTVGGVEYEQRGNQWYPVGGFK